jgi:hypothetical protein
MNLDRKQLEQRLDEISSKIDKLYEEQYSIQEQIKFLNQEEWKTTNNLLNIKPGTIIASIAQHEDYHYELFKLFVIEKIEDRNFTGNEFIYRFDDYEYSFKSRTFDHHISLFHELKNDQYLYNINEEQFNELVSACMNIRLNYKALTEYKDKFHFHNNGAIEIKA